VTVGGGVRSIVTADYLRISGGLITLVIVPVLPGSAPLGDKYRDGFLVLLSVAALLYPVHTGLAGGMAGS
jgi:hypothetical protein